jgi:cell division protein FtsL
MSARLFLLLLLSLAVIGAALAVVYQRHHHRQLFIELSRLENQRDELNVEFGRLQLELATMAATDRVEQIASSRLGMRIPQPDEQTVLVSP